MERAEPVYEVNGPMCFMKAHIGITLD